jgi:D-alanine-D-alanine ligase
MGGWSAEREVSLNSGATCADALNRAGHTVVRIDVSRDAPGLMAALAAARPAVVFNALHGKGGEDGVVRALLDLLGLRATHSGVLASALAMDKPMAKVVLRAAGVPVPDGVVSDLAHVTAGHVLPPPYVVKPAAEGSSVGVRIVRQGDNRPPIDRRDWPFEDRLLVEPYIAGRELTVAVMGDRALAVTEILPSQGFYDYAAKYTEGRSVHRVPADIPQAVEAACLGHALAAHRALGCEGVSRADFRWDDARPGTAGLFMLEVNTQPGMTPLSLVPEQARAVGISFEALCTWMVENATCHA